LIADDNIEVNGTATNPPEREVEEKIESEVKEKIESEDKPFTPKGPDPCFGLRFTD
jgi:hypothetical protein